MRQLRTLLVIAFGLITRARVSSSEPIRLGSSETASRDLHVNREYYKGENLASNSLVSRRDQKMVKKTFNKVQVDENGTYAHEVAYSVVDVNDIDTSSVPLGTCGRMNSFSAHVLIEHGLLDVDNITNHTLFQLETTFRDTYNSLNIPKVYNYVCDQNYLRVVDSVEVEISDVVYSKAEGETLSKRNFLYKITGKGVGVSNDTTLFDMPTVVSLAPYMHEPYDPTVCTCSNMVEEVRAPSDEEFRMAFTKEIDVMVYLKVLENIKTAGKVIEYDAVDCKSRDKEFYTSVIMEFAEMPAQEDYPALAGTFQNSYNDLKVNYCDPTFRVITDVQVEEMGNNGGNTRHLLLGNKKKNWKYRLRFRVRGRCKGCKRRTKLFQDATDHPTRRLAFDPDNSIVDGVDDVRGLSLYKDYFDWHHVFKGKDVCFCATHPKGVGVNMGVPSQSEFTHFYTWELKSITEEEFHVENIKDNGKS